MITSCHEAALKLCYRLVIFWPELARENPEGGAPILAYGRSRDGRYSNGRSDFKTFPSVAVEVVMQNWRFDATSKRYKTVLSSWLHLFGR